MPAESTPPQNLKLMIHVGPHKTATTSIQYFLGENSAAIERAGIYLPATPPPLNRGTVHHVAYELQGKSFGNIGLETNEIDLESTFIEWCVGARDAHCTTVLMSAEDLSWLTVEQWARFEENLRTALNATNTRVENITFLWTNRDIEEMSYSRAAEIWKAGSLLGEEKLLPMLRAQLETQLADFRHIVSGIGFDHDIIEFAYRDPEDSRELLTRWAEHTLGTKVARTLPSKTFTRRHNTRLDKHDTQLLRNFSALNTPPHLPEGVPFGKPVSDPEDIRARERYFLYRTAILQRHQALAELKKIQESQSYKFAAWLGRVGNVFRRGKS